jgi:hypothetical protein
VATGGASAFGTESGGSTSAPATVTGGASNTNPIDLQTFGIDVQEASDAAQRAGGPLLCAAMIPSVRVANDDEIDSVVVAYVSNILNVPTSDFSTLRQECGTATFAPCANIFQNDVAHYGGRMSDTTYTLAQRIDNQATNIGIRILTATHDGISLSAVVVLVGILDGSLVSIVVVSGQAQC